MRALIEVMRAKLIETLREGMSGTYSPGIGGNATSIPRPQYQITINFGSSPENADRLYRAAMAIVDTLKTQGPTQADVDKVREQLIRTREVDLKQNAFWISNIISRGQSGEDVAALLAPRRDDREADAGASSTGGAGSSSTRTMSRGLSCCRRARSQCPELIT
jgi:zinc protease